MDASPRSDRTTAGLLLLAGMLGVLYVRDVVLLVDARLDADVQAARDLVAGLPHWRVQQARLLGPLAVDALVRLGMVPRAAFLTFLGLAMAATQAVLALGLPKVVGTSRTLVAMLGTHALVTLLTYRGWLYAWDPGGLLVLTTFAVLVARDASTLAFAALGLVGAVNRESALAIPVFLVLEPLLQRRFDADGRRRVVAGVLTGAVSVFVIEALRSTLLVRELGPALTGVDPGQGGGYHPTLLQNVVMTVQAFRGELAHPAFAFLYPLVVVAMAVALGGVARHGAPRFRAAAAAFGLLLASVVLLAIVFEARTLLELAPALTVLPLCAAVDRRAPQGV